MKKKSPAPKITPQIDTFAGIKLEPMTTQREVVAAEMGMHFGFVEHYRTQFYLRDTIIATWLRSIPAEVKPGVEWCVDAAELEPERAMKAALVWAKKMGIGTNSPRFNEAWKIFVHTMKQIREATGEPIIPEEDKTDPPDQGEL